jgi:HSP20 family protein
MSQIPVNITPSELSTAQATGPARETEPPSAQPVERVLFTPPIDIYETAEGLVLIADLPGVSVKTLELQVQDNRLTLLGRVPSAAPPGAVLLHKEYEEGDFLRSFILSEDVDHERITAKLNCGVLDVVLPKAPQAAPRRIDVRSD